MTDKRGDGLPSPEEVLNALRSSTRGPLRLKELARDLVALSLPDDEELAIKYVMVTHERIEHSPAHDFLRGEILMIVERFRHKYGMPCLEDLRAARNLPY